MSDSVFNEVDLSDKRHDGESFAAYRRRRRDNKALLWIYLGGRLVWTGDMGPATREDP